ncbi:MAG TPA: hypothetical protein VHB98_21485 [Chloroflexota bacterium]|jgi:hypothetical protein|nr:hypothetical protein [Chloroflexota bacterium]
MIRIVRRFAAVLMIALTGYGITHAAVPGHPMAGLGPGYPPLPSAIVTQG